METIEIRITGIDRINNEAILLYLELMSGRPLDYLPGQFLTFIFQRGNREIRRSYSFFTTPGVDTRAGVLVKRVVNGEISRFLIDHLNPGDTVEALPPSGRFTLPADLSPADRLVCIAAGSGISPIFSIIKQALELKEIKKVSLIYQNRNEALTLFQEELKLLEQKYSSSFELIKFLSNPLDHSSNPARLNNTNLEKLLEGRDDLEHANFYLCGPPAFMRMCQFVLQYLHVPRENIYREIFYFETAPVQPLAITAGNKQVTLNWREETFRFMLAYPQTILDAALQAGIRLPYSCRGGRCSTCVLKCSSGKVVMSINETLTDKDLREGLILTCVGYAQTDLLLQYPV